MYICDCCGHGPDVLYIFWNKDFPVSFLRLMLRCVWICGRGGELDVCWGWACFLLTLKGVLTCGVYHLRVCFDCVCLSICTYKTESLCGHIKVLTRPEHIGRDFYKGFAFIVVDHPPWEKIHTCTDLKMVWKHTHTHTPPCTFRLTLFPHCTLTWSPKPV